MIMNNIHYCSPTEWCKSFNIVWTNATIHFYFFFSVIKRKKNGWHLGWLMQKFVVIFRRKNILEGHFEQQMRNLNWKFYGLFEARDELIWLMKSGSRKIRLKDFLTKSRRKKHTKNFVRKVRIARFQVRATQTVFSWMNMSQLWPVPFWFATVIVASWFQIQSSS